MTDRFPTPARFAILVAALFACAGAPVSHAAPRHAPKAKAAAPAAPAGEKIKYEDLEHRVGAELMIETTFHTTRRGTLIKYTQPTLTLELGPESGSIELTVPRETIKSITVLPTPAAADDKDADAKDDAKKPDTKKNH